VRAAVFALGRRKPRVSGVFSYRGAEIRTRDPLVPQRKPVAATLDNKRHLTPATMRV
jgi:hypothetical protein